MTLTTHAVTGALIGAVAAHSLPLAAVGGFASHLILDTIPHWDYPLASADKNKTQPLETTLHINKAFAKDLLKIGLDACIGLALTVILFFHAPVLVFVGALVGAGAALLPDLLQFVYFQFRREPFIMLQRFHAVFMHAKSDLDSKPIIGITFQVLLIAGISVMSWLYLIFLSK